jgi:hypothetical protein
VEDNKSSNNLDGEEEIAVEGNNKVCKDLIRE